MKKSNEVLVADHTLKPVHIRKPFISKIEVLTTEQWKKRYMAYLITNAEMSEVEALHYFNALEFGTKNSICDLTDNPEDAAEEEFSYWGD